MRERARSGSRGRMNRDQPEQWLHLVPGAAAQSRHAATAHGTSVPRTITRSPRCSASILSNTRSLNIHSLPRSNRFELFRGCSMLLLPSFGASSVMVIKTFVAFLAFFLVKEMPLKGMAMQHPTVRSWCPVAGRKTDSWLCSFHRTRE